MPIKKLKPITSGTHHMSILVNTELDKVRPEKTLVEPLSLSYGIDNYGHRTGRNRHKGHKRLYRVIDWKRNKLGILAKVATIEYDPNRTANIALLHYVDGEKRYILAPNSLKKGDTVLAMQYAIEFPDKVRSLVLINSPYQVSDTLLNLQKYIFKLMPSVLFKQGFSKMDCLKIIDSIKEKNSMKVSSIKIPTLIIYGEKDSINKKSVFKLSRDIKDSKLIEIKKSNHQINIEQSKKLADEINIFWMYINGINME